jgi:hypothetical protein
MPFGFKIALQHTSSKVGETLKNRRHVAIQLVVAEDGNSRC